MEEKKQPSSTSPSDAHQKKQDLIPPDSDSHSNPQNLRLVTWEGPDDPSNPKNWPSGRKWRTVFAVSGFVLMSPLSTTIVAPALDVIAKDLQVKRDAEKAMILSIFMLGFAVGPLFISPVSEIFGRTRVLQGFNLGFLAFNTACGGAQTGPQILALRFLAGLFGSCSVGVSVPQTPCSRALSY